MCEKCKTQDAMGVDDVVYGVVLDRIFAGPSKVSVLVGQARIATRPNKNLEVKLKDVTQNWAFPCGVMIPIKYLHHSKEAAFAELERQCVENLNGATKDLEAVRHAMAKHMGKS
jgi:hypothetical protein